MGLEFHNSTDSDARIISPGTLIRESIIVETVDYLKWVWEKRNLVKVITYIELRKTIAKTKLSYLWWFLDPFLNFICYLFLVLVLSRGGNFEVPLPVFIMTAIIPWHFTMQCVMNSTKVWSSYKALIGQVRFPYMNLLLANFLSELVLYSAMFVILFGVCMAYGYFPVSTWLLLPLMVLIHSLMVLTLMLLNALISLAFHDYSRLLPYILRIWFFVSPAVWSISMLPERFQKLIYLNPMTLLFMGYRDLLLHNRVPEWSYLGMYTIVFLVTLIISIVMFIRKEPYINRYIA